MKISFIFYFFSLTLSHLLPLSALIINGISSWDLHILAIIYSFRHDFFRTPRKLEILQKPCSLGSQIRSKIYRIQRYWFTRIDHFYSFKSLFFFILSKFSDFNSFQATGLFALSRKYQKNFWFSNIFKGYRKRPVVWNGLSNSLLSDARKQEHCYIFC